MQISNSILFVHLHPPDLKRHNRNWHSRGLNLIGHEHVNKSFEWQIVDEKHGSIMQRQWKSPFLRCRLIPFVFVSHSRCQLHWVTNSVLLNIFPERIYFLPINKDNLHLFVVEYNTVSIWSLTFRTFSSLFKVDTISFLPFQIDWICILYFASMFLFVAVSFSWTGASIFARKTKINRKCYFASNLTKVLWACEINC